MPITFKLQPASLARAYFRLVGCSDCCRLFIFFTNILKIFVVLLGYTKISRIFVKEITTKTKQNDNSRIKHRKRFINCKRSISTNVGSRFWRN